MLIFQIVYNLDKRICRPPVEVDVHSATKTTTIFPDQALRIQPRKKMVGNKGPNRISGEEWLESEVGI